ncbi:MAG: ABC transporter ATP-binding protein [Anaerolineae bacterium]
MSNMVEMQDVHKTFKIRGGEIKALRGVTFSITEGEFVAIVGPSGSGKSTMINMITGIDRPTQGEIYVAGHRLTKMNEDQVAEWRGHNVGVVFQFFQLLPSLTVYENVIMPMVYTGRWKGQRRQRALELLDRVGIADLIDKYPSEISGGQQQQSAIARALANDPQIIVGDEPTGNLDPQSAQHVFDLLSELVKNGKTLVLVTHDRDLAGRIPRVQEVRAGQLITGAAVDERLVQRA